MLHCKYRGQGGFLRDRVRYRVTGTGSWHGKFTENRHVGGAGNAMTIVGEYLTAESSEKEY